MPEHDGLCTGSICYRDLEQSLAALKMTSLRLTPAIA
jgi:hypothetical protein